MIWYKLDVANAARDDLEHGLRNGAFKLGDFVVFIMNLKSMFGQHNDAIGGRLIHREGCIWTVKWHRLLVHRAFQNGIGYPFVRSIDCAMDVTCKDMSNISVLQNGIIEEIFIG